MRAARLYGAGDIRIDEVERPVAGPGTSVIRVDAVGICGSDLHWYGEGSIGDAHLRRPLVLGHEFAGVVQDGPLRGRLVAADPAVPCGHCRTCLAGDRNLCPAVAFAGHGSGDGALREFVAWPTELLHPLPSGMTGSDGALLEPLGVALHALDLAHLRVGDRVGVFGCGPIGLLTIQLARVSGAGWIVAVDRLPHRCEAATRYGADTVSTPAEAAADRPGREYGGLDVAFEVAGRNQALEAAIAAVRPGARVVVVGIPDEDEWAFPASVARRKGISIVMARRMNAVYPRAIGLASRRVVDVSSLVTSRYPLERVGAAFAVASAREGLKVLVEPAAVQPGAEPVLRRR